MTASPGIVTGAAPPNAVVQIQSGMNVQPVVIVDQNGNYAGIGGGTAIALATTTAAVNVSNATAPTSGEVLVTNSGTSATWQTLLDTTATDIQPLGNQAAGAVGKAADAGHVHPSGNIIPSDHGLLAWSIDIDSTPNGVLLIAGTVYLNKIPIHYPLTATNMWVSTTSAGTGTSSGSYVGLYSSAGSLLAYSADLGSNFYSGNHEIALGTAQALSTGFVWAAVVVNQSTTQPSFRSPFNYTGPVSPNVNLTAANFRIAVPGASGTSQTSLPASFTPSALTNTGAAQIWFGIS
jgi:hypothetical protein